jgi:hypothetical protein
MSNALMIPEASEVPAYALNPELAKEMNAEAAAGISTGAFARIKLSGKQFVLVDDNGGEKPVKVGELFMAQDGNAYLPTVILRAKKEIQKAWYVAAYNPAEEGAAPDCFSNDGIAPDESVGNKQCDNCAQCPMNAFGSGKDQNGNATKGKACADNKILAVFCKGSIYKLKLPPASLKNFGLYVKELSNRGIPVGNVKTLLGFDEAQTFPILTFSFGGFIAENTLPQLAKLATSPEAEEIANDKITASAKALPAPDAKTEPATQTTQPVAETNKMPATQGTTDDLGLGLDANVSEPANTTEPVVEAATTSPSDAELAAELGL